MAFAYKNAGYSTLFISGGKIKWRNLDEFLPNQFFSEVYGECLIKQRNSKAKSNTWGVYDEYLFEEIFKQLSNDSSKSKLICALTTTNHTPYEIPEEYKNFPIELPDSIKNMIMANKILAEKSFKAYQYSNNCLGEFLKRLKESPLGENTIVAVTGDHNSYTLFPYDAKGMDELDKHRVPLYLYLPKALQKENYHSYTSRFSSHKDIFSNINLICLYLNRATFV